LESRSSDAFGTTRAEFFEPAGKAIAICRSLEATTAKLPPRVTRAVALGSTICGAILSNSTLVALRAAMPAIRASSVSKFCCCDDADPACGGRADLA
jgi:hypothetical protein